MHCLCNEGLCFPRVCSLCVNGVLFDNKAVSLGGVLAVGCERWDRGGRRTARREAGGDHHKVVHGFAIIGLAGK